MSFSKERKHRQRTRWKNIACITRAFPLTRSTRSASAFEKEKVDMDRRCNGTTPTMETHLLVPEGKTTKNINFRLDQSNPSSSSLDSKNKQQLHDDDHNIIEEEQSIRGPEVSKVINTPSLAPKNNPTSTRQSLSETVIDAHLDRPQDNSLVEICEILSSSHEDQDSTPDESSKAAQASVTLPFRPIVHQRPRRHSLATVLVDTAQELAQLPSDSTSSSSQNDPNLIILPKHFRRHSIDYTGPLSNEQYQQSPGSFNYLSSSLNGSSKSLFSLGSAAGDLSITSFLAGIDDSGTASIVKGSSISDHVAQKNEGEYVDQAYIPDESDLYSTRDIVEGHDVSCDGYGLLSSLSDTAKIKSLYEDDDHEDDATVAAGKESKMEDRFPSSDGNYDSFTEPQVEESLDYGYEAGVSSDNNASTKDSDFIRVYQCAADFDRPLETVPSQLVNPTNAIPSSLPQSSSSGSVDNGRRRRHSMAGPSAEPSNGFFFRQSTPPGAPQREQYHYFDKRAMQGRRHSMGVLPWSTLTPKPHPSLSQKEVISSMDEGIEQTDMASIQVSSVASPITCSLGVSNDGSNDRSRWTSEIDAAVSMLLDGTQKELRLDSNSAEKSPKVSRRHSSDAYSPSTKRYAQKRGLSSLDHQSLSSWGHTELSLDGVLTKYGHGQKHQSSKQSGAGAKTSNSSIQDFLNDESDGTKVKALYDDDESTVVDENRDSTPLVSNREAVVVSRRHSLSICYPSLHKDEGTGTVQAHKKTARLLHESDDDVSLTSWGALSFSQNSDKNPLATRRTRIDPSTIKRPQQCSSLLQVGSNRHTSSVLTTNASIVSFLQEQASLDEEEGHRTPSQAQEKFCSYEESTGWSLEDKPFGEPLSGYHSPVSPHSVCS